MSELEQSIDCTVKKTFAKLFQQRNGGPTADLKPRKGILGANSDRKLSTLKQNKKHVEESQSQFKEFLKYLSKDSEISPNQQLQSEVDLALIDYEASRIVLKDFSSKLAEIASDEYKGNTLIQLVPKTIEGQFVSLAELAESLS